MYSSAGLASTPADLLIEVAGYLQRSDVLNLSLTSKVFFSDIAPALYKSVFLNSAGQCTTTLAMLKRRKDIARHVRELLVRPSRSHDPPDLAPLWLLLKFASSRSLDALQKFTWCDDEVPYHEEMWLALRMCCPQLRYLSTSIGAYFPPTSHLFNFTDLLGFSIYLTPGFYENHNESLDETQLPSKRLWDMLFKRCPNLEVLAIEGSSTFPADAKCITDGRWPNLQKLTLGDISVVDWTRPGVPPAKSAFASFLEAHTELQSLTLSRHSIDFAQLNTLDSEAIKLTSFSGTLTQLQALSHSYSTIKSLSFRDPVWSRDVTTMAISGILGQLTALTELEISFMLHSPYDSSGILRALVAACPHLTDLKLSCIRKTSFQLDAFVKALPSFRRLRTLSLTLARATFELVCDAHDLPTALRVCESETTVWPWGLGASRKVKRYMLDLRPPGAPGRRTEGLRGASRNHAGEFSSWGGDARIRALVVVGLLCRRVCRQGMIL
ncbi:hypothetical protein FB45DRAFT_1099613 [Roridomyces roridus]|uniref:F-box domain-containing protein n=1 Tax=Roridomyces roridus TaxID=1738132 RepID=A0AAD7CF50_9AGAR|nr:hypothetical protein FB45DRAFT_1099613 [Roridomyces roridus]